MSPDSFSKAQAILGDIQALENLGKQQAKPLQFPLSIGVIPTIAPFLLPKVLPIVRANYPDAQLILIEQPSAILIEKIRVGELDTAIIALPYDTTGLHAFEFWRENFVWITHKHDKLVARKRIKAKDIDPDRLLLLEDGHCLKDHALAVCRMTVSKSMAVSGMSLTTLIQMICGKMGTTLVPDIAWDSIAAQFKKLVAVKIYELGPHRRLAFITRLILMMLIASIGLPTDLHKL